jgi:glycosyltransferase involved in cell wall biosynthesis
VSCTMVKALLEKPMRIVTNFARFPQTWEAENGLRGETTTAATAGEFWRFRGEETIWLVNCDTKLTLQLGALKMFAPAGVSLIVVDLVLRAPTTWRHRIQLPVKRQLLAHVDHFIHYFRDLSGYERVFGISAARSSFTPFKVNLVDRYEVNREDDGGEYVLCLGRSMRDFDTFFDALERLPYPAAITKPDNALFAQHGARFTRDLSKLPSNVRVIDDDGSDESMMRVIKNAKMVVLPVLKASMVASGISTALNAMILGKCIIGSEGPGMSDVFQGEVLVAPPENAGALAEVIRRAWEDDALRSRTAANGFQYARQVGGEPQLYQRIIDQVAVWYSARAKERAGNRRKPTV